MNNSKTIFLTHRRYTWSISPLAYDSKYTSPISMTFHSWIKLMLTRLEADDKQVYRRRVIIMNVSLSTLSTGEACPNTVIVDLTRRYFRSRKFHAIVFFTIILFEMQRCKRCMQCSEEGRILQRGLYWDKCCIFLCMPLCATFL